MIKGWGPKEEEASLSTNGVICWTGSANLISREVINLIKWWIYLEAESDKQQAVIYVICFATLIMIWVTPLCSYLRFSEAPWLTSLDLMIGVMQKLSGMPWKAWVNSMSFNSCFKNWYLFFQTKSH
jgi:hypothetical protein